MSAVWWVFLGLAMGAPIGIFVASLLVAWSRQEIEEAAYRRGQADAIGVDMERAYWVDAYRKEKERGP